MGEDVVDLRIWGKERGLPTPYPLLWHLVDTAAVAGVIWDLYLTAGQRRFVARGLGVDESHAKLLVMLWAGLHDLGKATPGFQVQCKSAFALLQADTAYGSDTGSPDLRHERASQFALLRLLDQGGQPMGGARSGRPSYRVAQMLGGHHGRFVQAGPRDSAAGKLGGGGWAGQRQALFDTLTAALGVPATPERVEPKVAVFVTGLIILADWLASQEHFLRRQLPKVPVESSVEVVANHLDALRDEAVILLREAGLGVSPLRRASFEETFPFEPNALQRSVRDELFPQVDGPGLLVVTAATGDGKTEAALFASLMLAERSGASGFYFALPTMATADQMYRRVARFTASVAEGPTAVTLLHSMSWLNDAYQKISSNGFGEDVDVASNDKESRVIAPDWMRGRRRGLLAGLSVGTIDQALMAALTTKHNALRLFGLSGKVFIVDEAHAYDDYMRAILCKLLTWLGSMGCSVILLSATLPASHVAKLTGAYRRGAGAPPLSSGAVPYPGWIFVPAHPDRPPVTISSEAQTAVSAGRRIQLRLDVRPVHHQPNSSPTSHDPLDRGAVIRETLTPLVNDHGCAGLVCNTVDEAQRTYEMVREWAGDRTEVRLLHSRFPAGQREKITREIVNVLGKDGKSRPGRMIVIATQVIEQSLDLDFDLVISDLAPFAQLIQRAGRCHRHRHPRPEWADAPRLVVLDPQHDGRHTKPRHWGEVYHPYLLRATHLQLADIDHVQVPEDIQGHMEAVYSPTTVVDPQLSTDYGDYQVVAMVERQAAGLWDIPEPQNVGDLSALSQGDITESRAATRLGAESVRVLCCYLDRDGGQWLDARCTQPLPEHGTGGNGRFSTDEIRSVLSLSIPVREDLLAGYQPGIKLPERWTTAPWLSDLQPLWFHVDVDGPLAIEIAGRVVHLDPELGLLARRKH